MIPLKIRITIALSFLLLPVLVQAQSVFSSTAAIDSMAGSPSAWPASLLKRSIPFGTIRVVDNRTDTTLIGLNSAKFIRMYHDNGEPYTLQKVVENVYKGLCSKNNDTLVMVINKFMIASNMHFLNSSWNYQEDITDGLGIACDFYQPVIDGYKLVYRFYYFNNPVLENRKSWASDRGFVKKDINSSWGEYLVGLFDTAFSALIKVNSQGLADSATAIPSVSSLKKHYEELPVNRDPGLKKGVYRNFKEFTDNAPGITAEDDSKLTAADSSCWGFCDGQSVFIRHVNAFYQVEKINGVWYLTASINALRKKTKQSDLDNVFSFTFFRLLTHPDEGKHGSKEVSPLVMTRIQNKNIMALQVDWDTGEPGF